MLYRVGTFKDSIYSVDLQFSSVQLLSRVQLFETPWIAARQASLSITNSQNSLKLTSIKSVMPSSPHPLSSTSPPAPTPFQHQSLFQWVNSSHEWTLTKVISVPASLFCCIHNFLNPWKWYLGIFLQYYIY